MSAKYVTITELEFDKVCQSEKGWNKTVQPGTREIVYTHNLKKLPHIQIKVYSSLSESDGVSRGCGSDAIRVCAVNTATDRGVRKTGRINRVGDWQLRLRTKVTDTIRSILEPT